jgi:hypothetical protein
LSNIHAAKTDTRLATFNVENLFERPAAMNRPKWTDGKKILRDFSELNDLSAQGICTAATKKRLLKIMANFLAFNATRRGQADS